MTFLDNPRLATLRQRLLAHPLYAAIQSPEHVCRFMQRHVFCVWDFMSLLKGLQQRLTCVEVPWFPAPDSRLCRLVNEIVLGEESDEDGQGGHCSHFELYLRAMTDARADVKPITRYLQAQRDKFPLAEALRLGSAPPALTRFVTHSLELARHAPLHRLAAAFALGREDIIPDMFLQLLAGLAQREPTRFGRFRYYLERHVHLDAEDHGPATRRLVEAACAGDARKQEEAIATACQCLQMRADVWEEIRCDLQTMPSPGL